MAAENEQQISLKLLVDEEKNRVVFAESDSDFVDILFSFLTMPLALGTIVRLLVKQSTPAEIGSLTSLYKGVADLDTNHLWTETCKTMLLQPKNSAETLCWKLKLNIDDTEPTKYFLCADSSCRSHGGKSLSTQKDVRCSCGKLMNTEADLKDLNINGAGGNEVFVDAKANYIVSDDLQVMPTSTGSILAVLNKLGIRNMNVLNTKTANVGIQEISFLLKLSLVSKTPLTDMFLREQVVHQSTNFDLKLLHHFREWTFYSRAYEAPSSYKKMTLKLIHRKSDNTILYAEAGEDFADFLFSFLTLPLGMAEELLRGKSFLGCIDNLYRSVGDLNVSRYMRSEDLKSKLLHPKLSPKFSCSNQPFNVEEVKAMPYYFTSNGAKISERIEHYLTFDKKNGLENEAVQVNFIDPKSPAGSITSPKGYVKGPKIFVVTDNLLVKPLSPILCIDILNKLNVPITDLDEWVFHVGKKDALSLLQASLISKRALHVGFGYILQKLKQEAEPPLSIGYSSLRPPTIERSPTKKRSPPNQSPPTNRRPGLGKRI